MLFTIQAYLDDYFRNHGLSDADGYSVNLANLYYYQRSVSPSLEAFFAKARKIRTVFYSNNRLRNRSAFEEQLLGKIETRFLKRTQFHGEMVRKIKNISSPVIPERITVENLLQQFKSIAEATAIDSFWKSRKKNILKDKPEKIAQALLASCLKMALNGKGIVVRELSSGIGFVDLALIISPTLHLIEIKILTKGFLGVEQLEQYMKTENRTKGNLVVLDAMPPTRKTKIPNQVVSKQGKIKILVIDLNPPPPSSLNLLKK